MPVYTLLVPAQWMQSYASCLLPSHLRCCSCLLFLCRCFLVVQLLCCVSFSTVLGFCSLLYSSDFTVHAGITCLCSACWDSVSELPDPWLVSIACWDNVSSFPGLWLDNCMLGWLGCTEHVGKACLVSPVYDWATACWDSRSTIPCCFVFMPPIG